MHSDATTPDATDWRQIVQLYDQLPACTPTPVVALHRAVAVAEVDGPEAALVLVDGLDLDGYHLFHAIRADLLREPAATSKRRRPTKPRSPGPRTRPNAISWSAG